MYVLLCGTPQIKCFVNYINMTPRKDITTGVYKCFKIVCVIYIPPVFVCRFTRIFLLKL